MDLFNTRPSLHRTLCGMMVQVCCQWTGVNVNGQPPPLVAHFSSSNTRKLTLVPYLCHQLTSDVSLSVPSGPPLSPPFSEKADPYSVFISTATIYKQLGYSGTTILLISGISGAWGKSRMSRFATFALGRPLTLLLLVLGMICTFIFISEFHRSLFLIFAVVF